MCCLCCDIYKRLDILVFRNKDEKPEAPSHSSFTVLILVGRKRTHTAKCWLRGGVGGQIPRNVGRKEIENQQGKR